MGSLSLGIHPLFFLFGVYYAFTGRIFLFIIYTITAIVHELGHSIVASRCGYKLNKIVLMPFGAVVSGEIEGLNNADELKIAFAGPLVSLIVAIIFTATWWIYPESYAFTDVLAFANFSTALVNLLPAYPLDGGRILFSLLSQAKNSRFATRVCKLLGIILGIILLGLFIVSIFSEINISILFFSAFIFVGALSKRANAKYVKAYLTVTENALKKAMPVKIQAVSSKISVKKLLSIIDDRFINEVIVYKNGKKYVTLYQENINDIVQKANLYQELEEII